MENFDNNTLLQNQTPMYTAADVAKLMGLSRPTIMRMFRREVGVVKMGRSKSGSLRRYEILRIPAAVYRRVIERLSVR